MTSSKTVLLPLKKTYLIKSRPTSLTKPCGQTVNKPVFTLLLTHPLVLFALIFALFHHTYTQDKITIKVWLQAPTKRLMFSSTGSTMASFFKTLYL